MKKWGKSGTPMGVGKQLKPQATVNTRQSRNQGNVRGIPILLAGNILDPLEITLQMKPGRVI